MGTVAFILICFTFAVCHGYPEEEDHDQDLFQGDMKLTPLQKIVAETGGDVSMAGLPLGRGITAQEGILWLPNRVVPYTIHPDLAVKPGATFGIMAGLREWETYTCLRFVERTVEKDYIEFFNNCTGCWSYVGRQGGMQNICLDDNCYGKGTVTHEIAHAMGVWHEQSRPDRDDYIRVVWDNVPELKKHNFVKYNNTVVNSLGVDYDYMSIMQYSKTAFGINRTVTMDPKRKGVEQLGQRVGFSESDIKQFTMLYQCNGTTTRRQERQKQVELKGPYDCTFEKGECHFMHNEEADFKWTGRVGTTPSWGTGPSADHTTGRLGRYMYIEATIPRKEGDVAQLISGELPPTKATCLSFHYHMFAKNTSMMGQFNIYQTLDCPDVEPKLLFSRSGSEKNEWIKESIVLTSDHPYRIVFEGVRGADYQGDMAIDDVSFASGRCTATEEPCQPEPKKGHCMDIADREGKYCKQWANDGLCGEFKDQMIKFCPRTCMYCIPEQHVLKD